MNARIEIDDTQLSNKFRIKLNYHLPTMADAIVRHIPHGIEVNFQISIAQLYSILPMSMLENKVN
jgi:hypothetical protein